LRPLIEQARARLSGGKRLWKAIRADNRAYRQHGRPQVSGNIELKAAREMCRISMRCALTKAQQMTTDAITFRLTRTIAKMLKST
jgi:hypothetical protein